MIVKLIRNWHELEARASDKNNIYDNTTRKGTSETLEPAGDLLLSGKVAEIKSCKVKYLRFC